TQHPNTLVYYDNMLFSSTSHETGMQMLRLTNGGRHAEQVWANAGINNRNGHAIRLGNYILTSNERPGIWYLINWYTGEIVFEDNSVGTGAIIFADGMFYILTERQEMFLVRPSMERLDVVSQFPITMGTGARSWAHPVIYNGVLFIRNGDALMAYRIK
ncbi:MAG: alcohol dehydrogenase, partial [Bacteroidales bacterium]|nr:alcohol dehydrogenase [Bacteroidales bacterium]